jgi:hypothetical protein
MYAMTSMELTDDEKLDAVLPIPIDRPDYPYGLRICLTHEELVKLGLDHEDAFIGGMVHGHFMARITSVSANDSVDGPSARVELQIEALAIESEDAENAEYDR